MDNITSSATGRDESRPVATSPDNYTLTIEEAAARYEHAGHPRTIRSIQRYCAQGHLDCLRQQTTFGDKYLITPESVARHLAQIAELASATSRDWSRQDATTVAAPLSGDMARNGAPTSHGTSRQDAAGRGSSQVTSEQGSGEGNVASPPTMARYVEQLEKRIEEKDDVIGLLKGQLTAKDAQINDLSERYRETHSLLGAMQRMFAPLLGQSDPYKSPSAPDSVRSVDN